MGTLTNSEDPDEMQHKTIKTKTIFRESNSILSGNYNM